MDEIKQLLQDWADGQYVNPDALQSAHQAVVLLVERLELLEAQVSNLTKE
jgi:hypothetical protein